MRFKRAFAIGAVMWVTTTAGLWKAQTLASPPVADDPNGPSILQQRLDHEGVAGTLVLGGGGGLGDAAKEAFASAVPESTSVVIVATAATNPDVAAESAAQWLRTAGVSQIVTAADDPVTLAELLRSAGGVWICGGRQSRLADAYAGSVVEVELQALLNRGGVIGGNSAGAAVLSGVMIASGDERPRIARGLDLVPGAIVDQHFSQRNRLSRLRLAVAEHPDRFGLGVDEATAVVIQGRMLQVVGAGTATILLAKSSRQERVEQPIPAGALVDLTQLRRRAVAVRRWRSWPAVLWTAASRQRLVGDCRWWRDVAGDCRPLHFSRWRHSRADRGLAHRGSAS